MVKTLYVLSFRMEHSEIEKSFYKSKLERLFELRFFRYGQNDKEIICWWLPSPPWLKEIFSQTEHVIDNLTLVFLYRIQECHTE